MANEYVKFDKTRFYQKRMERMGETAAKTEERVPIAGPTMRNASESVSEQTVPEEKAPDAVEKTPVLPEEESEVKSDAEQPAENESVLAEEFSQKTEVSTESAPLESAETAPAVESEPKSDKNVSSGEMEIVSVEEHEGPPVEQVEDDSAGPQNDGLIESQAEYRRLPDAPDYRASTAMDMEYGGGSSGGSVEDTPEDLESIGTVSKRKSPPVRGQSRNKPKVEPGQEKGVAQIRDFPRSLLGLARAEFPEAGTNTEAISAYMLAKSGRIDIPVPDSVKKLVRDWDGDKTAENTEKRLASLTSQVAILLNMVQELQLLVSYIAFDRLGYRQDMPKDIRNIDFLENGMTDLMARVREQTRTLRKQEAIKNGRPIR